MRLGVLELVLAFGVCVRHTDALFAQPLCDRTAATETTVINSDYVFVANVVGLRPLDAGDERYGQRADIAIEEKIKAELFREEPYTALNIYLPYRAAMDENIALVKPLIDDPQCFFHSAEGRSGECYGASRHAAYQTLKAWGMDVPQPVSREVVP